ncbi:RHS repeat domain-containing protein, partial [Streptomyces rubiginosohelvolus]|uniref:RHS repeat domain-containing protein n=1 Tax=Streptomyces rubiginosohelvolus TaxID=67362 RepID=UPI0033DD9453
MLTRKYSDGNTITYTYDADGRTSTMAADGKATTYTWDPAGNLVTSARIEETEKTKKLVVTPDDGSDETAFPIS